MQVYKSSTPSNKLQSLNEGSSDREVIPGQPQGYIPGDDDAGVISSQIRAV